MERKNVCVIGGAGFLGSHLCAALLEQYNVVCVDNYQSGSEQAIDALLSHPHFEFIRHDITEALDFSHLPGVERFQVAHTGFAGIFYCAHSSAPAVIAAHPLEILRVGSEGARNALELARETRARFVLVSDSLMYGSSLVEQPREEDQGLVTDDALRPLIESLRFAETLADSYKESYSLDVRIARLGMVYGPRMTFDDGRFISTIIARALENVDIAVPSYMKGSLLYVADAIDALQKIWLEAPSGVYNVAHTAAFDASEIAEKIIAHSHSQSQVRMDDGVAHALVWNASAQPLNIAKLRDTLGWFPVVVLEEGLGKTIDDMKARRNVKAFA